MLAIPVKNASADWDAKKKRWTASLEVGAEVVRRTPEKALPRDASDNALREWVVQTAKDEGYEIAAERVRIER